MDELQGVQEAVKIIDSTGLSGTIGTIIQMIVIIFLLKKLVFNGLFSWFQSNLEESAKFLKLLITEYLRNEKSRIESTVRLNESLEDISGSLKAILSLIKEDRHLMLEHHKVTEELHRQIKKRQQDFIRAEQPA